MDFRITGLPAEQFLPFFGMTDDELLAHGARRVVATADMLPSLPPCRVSLQDVEPNQPAILLHFAHHVSPASPYRAGGPIYVREGVRETASFVNHVPAQQRIRLLSVRAYDADGLMVDAEVTEGTALEAAIEAMFRRPDVAFLHAHNARRGCYSCRIDRA